MASEKDEAKGSGTQGEGWRLKGVTYGGHYKGAVLKTLHTASQANLTNVTSHVSRAFNTPTPRTCWARVPKYGGT